MIVAGLGLRPGCGGDEIAALVSCAARQAGRQADALSVPLFRADAASVTAAAAQLSVPVLVVTMDALAAVQPLCPTRSARVDAAVGVASVAEGCALAAAGPDGRLILPRIASANATCALAEGPGGG